jgi:hypothetical protein
MRWTKPSFFLPQFRCPLAKPSNGSFVLGFSPLLTYPEIKKKCGFSTGGVESAEKKTFWGFLGPFYQLFFFFLWRVPPFWFILRFLRPVSLSLG